MAEPRWIQSGERADGANHPQGYADIVNRPTRDFYATFGVEHSDDGTHKYSAEIISGDVIEFEGTGNYEETITPSISPKMIFGFRADTTAPILWLLAAGDDKTKLIGTAALQTDLILSGFGDIILSSEPEVNANGVDYYYFAI